MRLKNKKTGEIRNVVNIDMNNDLVYLNISDDETDNETIEYHSLSEVNEVWEDYKDDLYYIISAEHKSGYICVLKEDYSELCKTAKELGIGFETEKECQKAIEKLKAWKRLENKGFINELVFSTNFNRSNPDKDDWKAYNLLFRSRE